MAIARNAVRAAIVVAGLSWAGLARASDPANATLVAEGDSAAARLNVAAAIAAYTRAHQAAPRDYEAAWKLARTYGDQATLSAKAADQERYCAQAESLARAAIAIDPRGANGHAFLAVSLGKLALFAGGKRKVRLSHDIETEARTALELDPDQDVAHHVLGVWNREVAELSGFLRFFAKLLYGELPKGTLEASLQHLEKAGRLRPDVIPHRVETGITLASMKRYREAEQALATALEMPTSWATDDFYRAKARDALERVRRHVR
jgi:tetratricopeptide (TPR) repeat protein